MSVVARAKVAIGLRPKLGLAHEPARRSDRVWFDDGEGFSDALRIKDRSSRDTLEQHCPPIADQFGSSCVGEMAHALIAIVESVHGLPYDPPSPLAAYYQSVKTHTDPGMEPKDDGTYIRACLSEIRAKGVSTLADWQRARRNLMRPVPATIKARGYNRRGLIYEFLRPRSLAEEMALADLAIQSGKPVGFGWTVTERFMAHRGSAPYDARLRKSDRVRGGHAQVQVSARDASGVVRFRNSWGTGHGDGGYANVIAETVTRRDLVVTSGWERLVQHA